MKCPICGDTLKPSKKNPEFLLCHSCRKKFRSPKKKEEAKKLPGDSEEEEVSDKTQIYSRKEVQAALRKADKEKRAAKKASSKAKAPSSREEEEDDGEFHLRYANIPPKAVREKQEREMRAAYDELLSIGKEERKKKKRFGFFRRDKD